MKCIVWIVQLVLVVHISYSQQTLNLDFEQQSIEGTARPWGWEPITDYATELYLDDRAIHHGSYSLRISSKSETGDQRVIFTLEPFELKNNSVLIEGWIQSTEMNGAAWISLNYAGTNDTVVTEIGSEIVVENADWTFVKAAVTLPEEVSYVEVCLHVKGTGVTWFDNLVLKVNNQEKSDLEIAPPFTTKQLSWLSKYSSPLASVDAGPANVVSQDIDLKKFDDMVDETQIIAMGESTHGTSEFFRLKHRMLEHCVRNQGVRLFAIEDHQLVVRRVNNYVLGGNGDARSSMYGMLGVWQTEEVRDLIQWMRDYNDLHPEDKVQFVGFDIQNYSIPIDSLYLFVERKSHELLMEVKMHLDNLQQNGMNSYSVSDSVKLQWYNESLLVLELISDKSVDWLAAAKNRADSLGVYWGIQYANLVKQFAENAYRGHVSLYRDVAMAENVSWYLNVYKPGSKMLIWAHDVHISRGESPVIDENIYGGRSMGAHLSKKYGENYTAFGLFTYQGEYSCYVSYSNFTVTDCPLHIAPRGTLDEALHQVASGEDALGLFLNLKKARSNTWLTKPTPVRFANHVNIEYGYWTKYSIPYQFDGIFFIDKTTSARSYARE